MYSRNKPSDRDTAEHLVGRYNEYLFFSFPLHRKPQDGLLIVFVWTSIGVDQGQFAQRLAISPATGNDRLIPATGNRYSDWQHAQRLAVCTATGNMHSDWQHAQRLATCTATSKSMVTVQCTEGQSMGGSGRQLQPEDRGGEFQLGDSL